MKYEFTGETKQVNGVTLQRIRALVTVGEVAAGSVGGWLQSADNLSRSGDAWVYGDAQVCGNARVYGNARVCGDARVSGDAQAYGDARVCGNARVCGARSFLLIGPLGSRDAHLTVTTDSKIDVRFSTGCFTGSRAEFEAAVLATHGTESLFARQYAAAVLLASISIEEFVK